MRNTLFWIHFGLGLAAGLFILVMSVTGLALTYESQITDLAIRSTITAPPGAAPLDPDAMAEAALTAGGKPGQVLVLSSAENAPAELQLGRRQTLLLDPYTGDVITDPVPGVDAFFSGAMGLHRWLSLSGPNETGAAITGAANLVFVLLAVSGLILWLPPVMRWSLVRMRLWFRPTPTVQARHWSWHHVFGVWALVPLFLISLSGVVISYDWASQAIYTVTGEVAPTRRGPPVAAPVPQTEINGTALPLDDLMDRAYAAAPGSHRASVTLPGPQDGILAVTLDRGNGHQSGRQDTVLLDRATGQAVAAPETAPGSPAQAIRGWFRFVHTGEVYGIIGQTVAGLACIAAIMLVYSGASLGIRRIGRMTRRPVRAH